MSPLRRPYPVSAHCRPAWMVVAALALAAEAAAAQVVAVVGASSPSVALSAEQLADVFLGRSVRYPDGRPALPLDQAEGAPVRDEFYRKLTGRTPAQMKAHWSKIIFTGRGRPPAEVADAVELKRRIAQDPRAIGYLDQQFVDPTVRVVLVLVP